MTTKLDKSELALFVKTHEIDSIYYASGCETCDYGAIRDLNCRCGWSGDTDQYNEHMQEMVINWQGPNTPVFKKEPPA